MKFCQKRSIFSRKGACSGLRKYGSWSHNFPAIVRVCSMRATSLRSAMRNSGIPLWNSNKIARAAQAQISLCEAEAVERFLEDAQAFLSLQAGICAEDIAIGLVAAAPNASSELVKL